MPREFRYDVVQNFDTITENETSTGNCYTKEVNLVSYNDADPVYDIRNWTHMSNGEVRMGKGITLSLEEIRKLRDILNEMEDLKD
ncbi:MAG: hypothetical protein IJJ29_00485 [Solobacterium sp.]|nr:hypothetical protein [Solobacterium sp.]